MTTRRELNELSAKTIIARRMLEPRAGENGAALLNQLIEEQATEERDSATIREEMANAAGIDVSTVNSILAAGRVCPPIVRIEGFANVLDVGVGTIRSAFEQDGCSYGDDDEDG